MHTGDTSQLKKIIFKKTKLDNRCPLNEKTMALNCTKSPDVQKKRSKDVDLVVLFAALIWHPQKSCRKKFCMSISWTSSVDVMSSLQSGERKREPRFSHNRCWRWLFVFLFLWHGNQWGLVNYSHLGHDPQSNVFISGMNFYHHLPKIRCCSSVKREDVKRMVMRMHSFVHDYVREALLRVECDRSMWPRKTKEACSLL